MSNSILFYTIAISLTFCITANFGGIVENLERLDEFLDGVDIRQGGCPKIPNLSLLPLTYPKALIGEWHVLYMDGFLPSSDSLSNAWYRRTLKYSSHSCLKVTLNPMPGWKNDTNSTIRLVAKWIKFKWTFDLECEPTEVVDSQWICHHSGQLMHEVTENSKPKPDGLILYIIQDAYAGLNYALVLQCLPKLWTNWAIISKAKVIDPKFSKHFLRKVNETGFNIDKMMKFSNEKC